MKTSDDMCCAFFKGGALILLYLSIKNKGFKVSIAIY